MRRLIRPVPLILAGIVVAVVVAALYVARGDGDASNTAAFPTRTIEAGDVTVEVTPVRVDASGAEFEIAFDTHSVELDFDVAQSSQLRVGDTRWKPGRWDGSDTGGHHREGTLTFNPAGVPSRTVELRIAALPEPVIASWELEGGS